MKCVVCGRDGLWSWIGHCLRGGYILLYFCHDHAPDGAESPDVELKAEALPEAA